MSDRELEAYHELCAYTLEHARRDPTFLHQHVVDAFAAQRAGPTCKPIAVAFALFGLCLHLERGFSGRQVQQAHVRLARRSREWPAFPLPERRGAIRSVDVLAAAPGPDRDTAIEAWARSVWEAYAESKPEVIAHLRRHGFA